MGISRRSYPTNDSNSLYAPLHHPRGTETQVESPKIDIYPLGANRRGKERSGRLLSPWEAHLRSWLFER